MEDRLQTGVDTLIAPWKPPSDDKAPFKTLKQAIKEYPPGQGFIDGGGFKVVKETDNYIYVQYEALKKGYIGKIVHRAQTHCVTSPCCHVARA